MINEQFDLTGRTGPPECWTEWEPVPVYLTHLYPPRPPQTQAGRVPPSVSGVRGPSVEGDIRREGGHILWDEKLQGA